MGLFDFLGGKTREQIDNDYAKALKSAGEERSRAVENAVYENNLYNANKDYFDKMGVAKPAYASDVSKAYASEMDDLEKERAKAWRQNKYNVAGNGMIGAIVNPLAQVGSIAGDMFASPFRAMAGEETNRYRRDPENDFLSDIGAIGETAFDVAGMGTLGDAVKGGAKLMSNVGKTALRTGALGAGENAFSTIREQGQDTDWGDVALSGAIGGAFGGGLGAISQFGGNASNMAKNLRSGNTKQLANAYADYLTKKNSAITDTARLLGDGAGGATVGTKGTYFLPNELKVAMQRMDTPLAKTRLGRVAQGIADSRAIYGSPLSSIANSRLGQTTRNILKTPAGKIGAGVGGGLLVANLLRGNGQPNTEMTDEELYQLLNNYNNGGY